jgi:hypothetical protein
LLILMEPVILKFFVKSLLASLLVSQLYCVANAQQNRPRDGQFIGKSNTGDSVYAVVRSGKVISARFEQRVSGCDNSDPSWDCSRVNSEIRVIDSCTIVWTVPWEDGYSFSAKLQNKSCQ